MLMLPMVETAHDLAPCTKWQAAFLVACCVAVLLSILYVRMLLRRRWIRIRLIGAIVFGVLAGPTVCLTLLGVGLTAGVLGWTAIVLIVATLCLTYLERKHQDAESAEQLYDDARAVFRLYFDEGKTLSDIASGLNMSRSRVIAIFKCICIVETAVQDDRREQ